MSLGSILLGLPKWIRSQVTGYALKKVLHSDQDTSNRLAG